MFSKSNKINLSTKIVFLLICLCGVLGSCSDYLEVDATNVASEETQWKDITDTRSSLMGIYTLLRSAMAEQNSYWMYGELRMGDFKSLNRPDLQAVINNNLNVSYPLLNDLADWRRFYAVINAASVFIENAPRVLEVDPRYSESNLAIDIAQARALRAFTYFYMVRIWGDVPLITRSYDNGSFEANPRTDQGQVLSFAKNELIAAAKTLPYLYGTDNQDYYGETSNYWLGMLFNKVSAYAVLAHITAWNQNYLDVEYYSQLVMDNASEINASYTSVSNLTGTNGIFAGRAPSRIVGFGFLYMGNEASREGHIENLTLAEPFIARESPEVYVLKDSILSIFDNPYDLRFGIDTISENYRNNYFTNFNSSIPIFSKIKVIRDGISEGDYDIFSSAILFTRLEEIALLRAEALAALGRETEAVPYLNQVRTQRGLPLFNLEFDGDLIDAIFAERRRELMGEGWRFYDAVRYHRLKRNNEQFLELIDSEGIYWPVAQSVLSNNPQITQNSYWQ